MFVVINIYIGTELQTPQTVTIDNVRTYQDIIIKLIKSNFNSGKLYTLDGALINNGDLITIKELNYIVPPIPPQLESQEIISVITNTEPPLELQIPYSSDMTYEDVYNYSLAQTEYHLGFLRLQGSLISLKEPVTEIEGLTLDLGVMVHISTEGQLLETVYIADVEIYQDIITKLIQSGQPSGVIYTLTSTEVNYNSPILEPEVHYIIMIPESTYRIPITIVGTPLYNIEIPGSKGMSYRDVYNYVVSQVEPKDHIFLVTNNGRTNLKDIIKEGSIFAFYELP
jgi:hypothetical protein